MSKVTVDVGKLAAIRKAIYHLGNTLSRGTEPDYQLVESTALMVTDIIRDAELFDIGVLSYWEENTSRENE